MASVLIRREAADDIAAIREIVEAAFGQPDEARLVDRLRGDGDAVISAVAVEDGGVVGHILFSKMAAPFPALGLAPVSVRPDRQGSGIGSALIRWGIGKAAEGGWQGILVLGDNAFYERFGFDAALAAGFASPYAGPHFMALALVGLLPMTIGNVDYAPAFGMLG